jgi:uncharacterized membrane protein
MASAVLDGRGMGPSLPDGCDGSVGSLDFVSVAFVIVFALFVLAMVGLAVTAVRWGVRRDRTARREMAAQAAADHEAAGPRADQIGT